MKGFEAAWLEEHRVDVGEISEDDVIGIGHVMREVRSLLGRLRHPEVMAEIGAEMPRGILFHGSPGSGKTLTARYLASQLERDVPMFEVSSDELTPDRVRGALRHLGETYGRAVLYIDEIDSFALSRQMEQHTPQTRAVLVAMLAALDGLIATPGTLVIASTNRWPAHLDAALLRAGRLGFKVQFDLPEEHEREQLFELFARSRRIAPDVDFARAAQLTRGSSPADIRQILDDALGLALADGRRALRSDDLDAALRRDGHVRPEDPVPPEELRATAIHEAGHVAAAVALEGREWVYAVTIGPEGGQTQLGGERMRAHARTEGWSWNDLVGSFAGAAAEELVIGQITLGCKNDLQTATGDMLSRVEAGMERTFPPLSPDVLDAKFPETLRTSLAETLRDRLAEARRHAVEIVAANRQPIEQFAAALLDQPELTGAELAAVLREISFTPVVARPGRDAG